PWTRRVASVGPRRPQASALALHDALPIQRNLVEQLANVGGAVAALVTEKLSQLEHKREALAGERLHVERRRATWEASRQRLNDRSEEHTSDSSHVKSSYAVFCWQKKKTQV